MQTDGAREGMSLAESSPRRFVQKVHPGADRRKCISVFLYVRHTLRVWSGKGELPFSIEWNHGYLRLYVGDGGFFVSLRMKEKEEVEQLWESSVM